MTLDQNKKIEIQEKLIEKLTKENENLKLQLANKEENLEQQKKQYNDIVNNYEEAKNRYEQLIKDLESIRTEYQSYVNIYRKLTHEKN